MFATREEHLDRAKEEAFSYLDKGKPMEAYTAFVSDMRKHPDLKAHPALPLGMQLLLIGELDSTEKMRHFIEGFN